MKLSELKRGETVFIDSNIFLYHFTGVSKECKEFLKRCEMQDLLGITGVTILAEVCHRLMIAEAIERKLIRPQRPASQLQEKPEIIKSLSEYSAQLLNLMDWNIKVISSPEDMVLKSQVFRSQFGLLTHDSFIPVYMRFANTNKLATHDKALSRIPLLEVYSPSDI